MQFYLVDIKDITSDIPRSNFAESDLETLADIIIETGGIIKPLVIKAISPESYTVVDGHFEYYAAVRAKEKNPRKGEMVNAFVISQKTEDLVVKQIAAIEGLVSKDKPSKPLPEKVNLDSSRLANLELRLEKQFNELKSEFIQERHSIDDKFKQIEKLIPQKTEQSSPLHLLNTLDKHQLSEKLQRSRIPGAEKVAKAIADARNKLPKKEFEDYRHLLKSVKGLGEKSILTIIDEW
jgi:phenylalanyl-tRNA synthetase alpha subunit